MDIKKLRLLTYNTHLMKDSAIDKVPGSRPPVTFEDDERRGKIIQFIKDSGADIVGLQEVWAESWQHWFIGQLGDFYKYNALGDPGHIFATTSGLVLLSKYPISDYYFDKYGNMKDEEKWSTKGILCVTITLPGDKPIRVGLTHATTDTGGDNCRDLEVLAWHTSQKPGPYPEMPAIIMGDFNAHANKYPVVKRIMDAAGAVDSWKAVHGDGDEAGSQTIDMRNNTLDQFFSPDRGTADPSRIDYIFVKQQGKKLNLKPVAATVPRHLSYISKRWYWAHGMTTRHLPSATIMGDDLYIASLHYGSGRHNALSVGVYKKNEKKWSHYNVNGVTTSGAPGIIYFEGKLHLFFRDPGGNGTFHITSEDGRNWSQASPLYIGFDTGGCCCPVIYDNKLYLFHVDPDGKEGGRVYYHIYANNKWGGANQVEINTRQDISAVVFGNKLCIVCKDNSGPRVSGGLMYGVLDSPGARWKTGRVKDVSCSGSPGLVVKDGQLHAFFRDPGGNAIFNIWTDDAVNWHHAPELNTMRDCEDAVCPVAYDGKVLVFYPTPYADKYRSQLMCHFELPNIPVDLSDHYPYIVDLEVS